MYRNWVVVFCLSLSLVTNSQQPQPSLLLDSSTIAFASDTQAPMWIETLWLKKNNNQAATKKLFSDIGERRPGSLFILGDVVNLGSSKKQWRPMDNYINSLRGEGIGVHACLGNHEVMGRTDKGLKKFQERFPDHVKTGFVQIKDSIAIVLLNSNFTKLTKAEDEAQVAWYKNVLAQLDANPAVQYVVTGCHHSPYTNSKIVGSATSVQQKFVPAFLASQKSRVFLSGHCHGFEHYQVQGKDFFVIGGGGGLHQPLKTGAGALSDLAEDYKPLFHYLTIRRKDGHLQITSYKITTDFKGFEQGMTYEVSKAPIIPLASAEE